MKKLVAIFSLCMLVFSSFAFGQSEKKAELSASDVSFSSPPTSSLVEIKIHLVIGRVSKGCLGFGFCGGTADAEVNLKNANSAEGYLENTKNGNYFRFDLATAIDTSKFDSTLYIDKDITIVQDGSKYTLLAGAYTPKFGNNKNGSYYITLKK
ncbi:hypothetical protein Q73A0000_10015 [Kaistella flava (ex Peng et al. 2021)]|uniref:Lipocalin-like domain-containing protein n=1 Tax=Kaistella flava (ex Peng et al. 2021) TaxID=2038776 RepID=A0A7M2YAM4_9FLAO|nr:hypothetical protein [Kaistella flava (ex Peng et al. 2021)]QOW10685.1 hypothetical protein Q73A0000_10015 [Kaistella flava (ex Peng et al. 2021)]